MRATRIMFPVGSVLLHVSFGCGGLSVGIRCLSLFGRAGLKVCSQVTSLSYLLSPPSLGSHFTLFFLGLRNTKG